MSDSIEIVCCGLQDSNSCKKMCKVLLTECMIMYHVFHMLCPKIYSKYVIFIFLKHLYIINGHLIILAYVWCKVKYHAQNNK